MKRICLLSIAFILLAQLVNAQEVKTHTKFYFNTSFGGGLYAEDRYMPLLDPVYGPDTWAGGEKIVGYDVVWGNQRYSDELGINVDNEIGYAFYLFKYRWLPRVDLDLGAYTRFIYTSTEEPIFSVDFKPGLWIGRVLKIYPMVSYINESTYFNLFYVPDNNYVSNQPSTTTETTKYSRMDYGVGATLAYNYFLDPDIVRFNAFTVVADANIMSTMSKFRFYFVFRGVRDVDIGFGIDYISTYMSNPFWDTPEVLSKYNLEVNEIFAYKNLYIFNIHTTFKF